MKHETDRQQLDFGDFSRRQLLDAVEAMSGHVIGRQRPVEVASGYAHLSGAHLLDAARKLDDVLAQAQADFYA